MSSIFRLFVWGYIFSCLFKSGCNFTAPLPTVTKSGCDNTVHLSLSNGEKVVNDRNNEDNWILEEIQRLLLGEVQLNLIFDNVIFINLYFLI